MDLEKDYFFDSYAIIEIIRGNPNYESFANCIITTSVLNLGEVYYSLLRENDEKTANLTIERLDFNFIDIDSEMIIEAMKFRHKHKKEELSYTDCIGYVLALKNNLVFLTGDIKFKDKNNVEFAK